MTAPVFGVIIKGPMNHVHAYSTMVSVSSLSRIREAGWRAKELLFKRNVLKG